MTPTPQPIIVVVEYEPAPTWVKVFALSLMAAMTIVAIWVVVATWKR